MPPPQPPAQILPPNKSVLVSVTTCAFPLSLPTGCEHVSGPVPSGLDQPLQVVGEFPGPQEGQEGLGPEKAGVGGEEGQCSGGPLAYTGLCTQACGPTMQRACGENMYVEGSCLLLGSQLQIIQTVPSVQPGKSLRDSNSVGAHAGTEK